ncbi:TIGR00366 family protein [Haloarcula sp. S1CR25-12]|uniref:TIGR00366 family protein n=1 Tax=Haloarcula saliterrae TaxID=2950534 RepID=A0ABU2FGP1_9EURY|nr:TIGR00366 family protein [Haloarcula sp. S1CR25-12]MDS0260971.1 TIGR00366 family protein [Haloarcula sp. S1CR25-12]
MLALLRRFGELCSDLSEEYIPDPYVIAILLTFIASAAALLTGAGPQETLVAWNRGVWTLLPFMASIAVLLMAGDAIAKSPKFTSQLEKLARLPNSQFTAVWFVGFVAMAAALVSWAIGLIVGAIMAKRVAYECREKGIAVHYPLLAAAGYTSLMIYHGGLTSSVSLMMADSTLVPTAWAPEFRQTIPLSETIGSTANIVTTGTLLAIIPVVMGLLHPKDGITQLPRPDFKEIDQIVHATAEKPAAAVTADGGRERVADRLNDSRLIGLSIALFPAYFVINAWVLTPGGVSNLTLNSINALFITVAVLLWVRPMALVDQMKQSVSNISGVIFQFPFYAGIAGILTGTGLATLIVEFVGAFATPATWPVIGVLVAGFVNIFIPSGGGQWVAMGPIMLEITAQMGMEPRDALLIEMLGDQLTNMIQPFWAIPLLAIANLRARDIIGYTTVAMLVGLIVVCGWLTVFLVVL